MSDVEEYFGCQCHCLNHVSQFLYFFPKEGSDPADDEMYFSVQAEHLYSRVVPPISYHILDWKYDFGQYFRFHFFRRIWIAANYLTNPYYKKEFGVMDCADYTEEDLPRLDETLLKLTNQENCESLESIVHLKNKEWFLVFKIYRIDEDMPYWFGWELHFEPFQSVFKRIKNAFKFLFGKSCGEQSFNIEKSTASKLRGMISATIGANTIKEINNE